MEATMTHRGNGRVSMDPMPAVLWSPEVYADLMAIKSVAASEVGVYVRMRRLSASTFLGVEVLMPRQAVNPGQNSPEPNAIGERMQEMRESMSKRAYDRWFRKERKEWLASWYCYLHKHPGDFPAACNPSRDDEIQMASLAEGRPLYIQAIVNDIGQIRCNVFFHDKGVRCDDVPQGIYHGDRLDRWRGEFLEKAYAAEAWGQEVREKGEDGRFQRPKPAEGVTAEDLLKIANRPAMPPTTAPSGHTYPLHGILRARHPDGGPTFHMPAGSGVPPGLVREADDDGNDPFDDDRCQASNGLLPSGADPDRPREAFPAGPCVE